MIFKDFNDAVACKDKGEFVVRIDNEKGETIGYETFNLDRLRETFTDAREKYLEGALKSSYDGIGMDVLKGIVYWDKLKQTSKVRVIHGGDCE